MKEGISIITINYNTVEDTMAFLAAIENTIYDGLPDLEVIVVDNDSSEDPACITASYPWVKLVRSEVNLGFAGGNNLGIAHSSKEFILMVNNDTLPDMKEVSNLLITYQAYPEYTMLCPLIMNEDSSIQYAGYSPINTLTGRNRLINQIDHKELIIDTCYPHGAAMLISRKNLEKVGMMAENYFLYYEETDWGERMKQMGLKIGVCTLSKITHKTSASVSRVSDCKLYFTTRNRILFARKHFPAINQFLFVLFFLFVSTPKHMLRFIWNGDKNSIQTYFQAIKWHFQNSVESTVLGFKFDALQNAKG